MVGVGVASLIMLYKRTWRKLNEVKVVEKSDTVS